MDGVRTTSRPQLSLPDAHAAAALLQHEPLAARFIEITRTAGAHLFNGADPRRLFGSVTDTEKFHECLTCFALAAYLHRDTPGMAAKRQVIERALRALPQPWAGLEPKTWRVVVDSEPRAAAFELGGGAATGADGEQPTSGDVQLADDAAIARALSSGDSGPRGRGVGRGGASRAGGAADGARGSRGRGTGGGMSGDIRSYFR
jgi:hypothetical protein